MSRQQQSEMPVKLPTAGTTFVRLSWLWINDRDEVLFLESPKRQKLFEPGGKPMRGLSEKDSLAKKILQDLEVRLVPETIEYAFSFKAQAFGKPDDTMMETRCFRAEFEGKLRTTARVSGLHWLTTSKGDLTTESGRQYLRYLNAQSLIW